MDKRLTRHIAIIGGGWAGLACAVELAAAGQKVCVFEAARQLGGRARRVDAHGHALDNGQHILIGAYRDTLRVMRLCNADPERLLQRHPLELNFPASSFRMRLLRLPAPMHLAVGLLATHGCSLGEKFAAARFIRTLQAQGYEVGGDLSVAELLDRHRQTGSIRHHMWEPLCLAALNTPLERASAQIFANVLRDSLGGNRQDTDLLLPTTDLDRLFPECAARFVTAHGGEIRLSSRVERMECRGETLAINGEPFDHIVVATAPQHAASLLERHTETRDIATRLGGYDYEPIGTVYLGYPDAVQFEFPMLGMGVGTPGSLGQWVFDRGQLGGMKGVMGFVLSAQGAWDQLANNELAAALHGELQHLLGRTLPEPLWHQVIRERRATFSCRPGLHRPETRTPLRGLWLAGDYVCAEYPATLEAAVRSGVAAALGILFETVLSADTHAPPQTTPRSTQSA